MLAGMGVASFVAGPAMLAALVLSACADADRRRPVASTQTSPMPPSVRVAPTDPRSPRTTLEPMAAGARLRVMVIAARGLVRLELRAAGGFALLSGYDVQPASGAGAFEHVFALAPEWLGGATAPGEVRRRHLVVVAIYQDGTKLGAAQALL